MGHRLPNSDIASVRRSRVKRQSISRFSVGSISACRTAGSRCVSFLRVRHGPDAVASHLSRLRGVRTGERADTKFCKKSSPRGAQKNSISRSRPTNRGVLVVCIVRLSLYRLTLSRSPGIIVAYLFGVVQSYERVAVDIVCDASVPGERHSKNVRVSRRLAPRDRLSCVRIRTEAGPETPCDGVVAPGHARHLSPFTPHFATPADTASLTTF